MSYDSYNNEKVKFEELVGKTLVKIEGKLGDENMVFEVDNGDKYQMVYYNDCCASATVEDIIGNLEDLIGNPILQAEEVVSEGKNPEGVKIPEYQDSFTWTFYKLATIKGYVTIRWYGESNGYYSESVDFEKIISPKP